MLEAFFYQTPNGALPPGTVFRVTGYARVEPYTLVFWRWGDEDEYATGETLYKGRVKLAWSGGQLPMYEPAVAPEHSASPAEQHSVWDQIDGRIGQFGVPPAVAIALRHPRNIRYFE